MLLAPLLYFGLLFVGPRSSFFAEVFAGSQVSRCSFDFTCFNNYGDFRRGCCQFWCPKRVMWHACCVHFGTLGDHRAIQGHLGAPEHQKGDLGVLAWISVDVCVDFGTHFDGFFANFGATHVFVAPVPVGSLPR